jgi:hypothetical protein
VMSLAANDENPGGPSARHRAGNMIVAASRVKRLIRPSFCGRRTRQKRLTIWRRSRLAFILRVAMRG